MALREGILALLAERDRHGYDLRTEFEDRTAKLWKLNSGQVYTTLDRLERDRLVVSGADPDDATGRRRRYRLSPEGRTVLEAWLDGSSWSVDPPRDELLMKVLLVAGDAHRATRAVVGHRRRLLVQLQRLRQEQRSAPADRPLVEELAADGLVVRLEADLHWLDRCEQRLARQKDPRR